MYIRHLFFSKGRVNGKIWATEVDFGKELASRAPGGGRLRNS
jgi:hypothetical protein